LDVQSGFAFKTAFFSTTDGVPLIRIRDVGTSVTEARYVGEFRKDFWVVPGDYLIGMDGDFRCRRWSGPPGLLNQRVCRLRNFSSKVLAEYVFYGIQPRLDAIETATSFATVKHISARQILDIDLPLPDIDEQRRILDFLSRAETLVRLRRQAADISEEIIPAMFAEMFGDISTSSIRALCDVANVVSGVAKGRRFNGRHTVMAPYLRVANVQAGRLDLSEIKEIEALPKEVEELALRRDDVLLTEGGDEDKLGRGAIWNADIPNCIHQNHVFRVRVNGAMLRPLFFATFLQTKSARAYFLRSAKRTTNLASINMTQLRDLPVPVPPIALQRQFEEQCQSIQSIVGQIHTALTKSEELFQALLHRAFRSTV
jgi:type I restriction enzyme S subunit